MPRYHTVLDLYLVADDQQEVEHVIAGMEDCFDYNTPHLVRRTDIVELPEDDDEDAPDCHRAVAADPTPATADVLELRGMV